MPIVGTPVTPIVSTSDVLLTTEEVRIFLRDRADPEFNLILDGVDFKDDEIASAIKWVTRHYNATPPLIGTKTEEAMISNSETSVIALYGVAGHLLKGEAVRQARNQVSYQDGDITLGIHDKAALFLNLGNSLWGEFLSMTKQYKISKNMGLAFGSFASSYLINY